MSRYHRSLSARTGRHPFSGHAWKRGAPNAPFSHKRVFWPVGKPHRAGAGFLSRGGNPGKAFSCGPKPPPPGPGGSRPTPNPVPGGVYKPGE